MAMIEARDLARVYNPDTVPVYALRQVTVSIEAGEFTAIVGPSGSGKSTLLNLLGGLDSATEGSVRVDDTDLATLTGAELIRFRRDYIGFVFQSYNLIPVFTAWENIAFVLQLQKRSPEQVRARVDELLDRVGLSDRRNARPNQMSGGQQQRVAVARALATEPRFILADEPTANLDTASADNLLSLMEDMNRDQSVTFLFSTHDQRVIERARRVVTLQDGTVTGDTRHE